MPRDRVRRQKKSLGVSKNGWSRCLDVCAVVVTFCSPRLAHHTQYRLTSRFPLPQTKQRKRFHRIAAHVHSIKQPSIQSVDYEANESVVDMYSLSTKANPSIRSLFPHLQQGVLHSGAVILFVIHNESSTRAQRSGALFIVTSPTLLFSG